MKKLTYNRYFAIDANDVFYNEGAIRYIHFLDTYEYFIMKDCVTTYYDSRYKEKYSENKSKVYHSKGSMNTRIEQKQHFRQILKENDII